MIQFTNGKSLSNLEAAALIRAEPDGLITDLLIDLDGHRCVGGVLMNFQPYSWLSPRASPSSPTSSSCDLWGRMVYANNSFVGTLVERREFMAQWFESQPESEEAQP